MHNATCPCCQCGRDEDKKNYETDRVLEEMLLGLEIRFNEWLLEQLADAALGVDEDSFDAAGVLATAKSALIKHLEVK